LAFVYFGTLTCYKSKHGQFGSELLFNIQARWPLARYCD